MSEAPDANFSYRTKLRVDNWSSSNAQFQCAIFDAGSGHWYLSQALPPDGADGDEEDTRIHSYDSSGTKLLTMKLKLFGHGAVIGSRFSAEGNEWIWVPVDSYDSNGNTTKSRIGRVLLRSGTYDLNSSHVDVYDVPDLGKMLSPFSVGPKPKMGIRYGKSDEEVYYLVDEDDVKAGIDSYAEKWRVTKSGRPGPFQGCVANWETKDLFVLSGSTNETNLIQHYRDGEWIDNRDVKIADLKEVLAGEVATTSSIEPEGLCFVGDDLVMGARTGPTGNDRDFTLLNVLW